MPTSISFRKRQTSVNNGNEQSNNTTPSSGLRSAPFGMFNNHQVRGKCELETIASNSFEQLGVSTSRSSRLNRTGGETRFIRQEEFNEVFDESMDHDQAQDLIGTTNEQNIGSNSSNQQVDSFTKAIIYFVNLINQQQQNQQVLHTNPITNPQQPDSEITSLQESTTSSYINQPTTTSTTTKVKSTTKTRRSTAAAAVAEAVVNQKKKVPNQPKSRREPLNISVTPNSLLEQQQHKQQHNLFLDSEDLEGPIDPLQLSQSTSDGKRSSSGSGSGSGDSFVHYCHDCGKRYSTSSNLARHRQTHRDVTDKKAKKCPECDKIYVSMPAFSMHLRTHNQGCICSICGKSFSRPWLLQGHMRTHTGEKPFRCKICDKAFADKSNLRAHIQTHSTTKPFVCGRCNKAFALKSYLCKHVESTCMRANGSQKEPLNLKVLNHPRRNRSSH